jgi:hypothetical protein
MLAEQTNQDRSKSGSTSIVLRPIPARRGRRRLTPFYATRQDGPFQPPIALTERAQAALEGFGNREACWRLLVFAMAAYGRPGRLGGPFRLVRELLAENPAVGLTLRQVQSATDNLAKAGLIDRLSEVGEGGRQDGSPRLKAIAYRFAPWVFEALAEAVSKRKRKCSGARTFGPRDRFRTFAPRPNPTAPKGFSGKALVLPAPDPAEIRASVIPTCGNRDAHERQLEAWLAKPPEPLTPLRSSTLAAGRFGRGQSPSR